MKKTVFVLLFLPLITIAQTNSGIKFRQENWNQLLASAKSEKKILFVDAFASWCGPCKKMASNVFTDRNVGEFFNSNFINAKIDMETGEGPDLSERYGVSSYPTFLFLDGNGKLLHKTVGYQEAADFIGTGRSAMDPDQQFYTLRDRFDKGTITDDQLLTLALQASEMEEDRAADYARSYLDKQKNWLNAKSIRLILSTTTDPAGSYFSYLSKNEQAAAALLGGTEVRDGLDMIAYRKVATTIDFKQSISVIVSNVEKGLKKYRPASNAQRLSYQVGQYLAENKGDESGAKEYFEKLLTQYPEEASWQDLNEAAWNAFKNETEPRKLQQALGWALKSVEKDSNFYNNDTVANLYFKLGKKKEAKKYAETALKLGKAAGEDTSDTETLLKKLS